MSAGASRRGGSLTRRMLGGMVVPMAALALALGLGGALVIAASVRTVNDRILGAASRAIAESLAIDEGQVDLNLSPAIFGMLEDNARDNVYYAVRRGRSTLTGYADLPDIAPRGLADLEVAFGDGVYRGLPVRIVAEGRRLPGMATPLVIEVAETTDARVRTVRRLLIALAALEAVLIATSAVLLPIAVRWGMRPLASVRATMDSRSGADLSPLPVGAAPAELRELVAAFNRLLGRLDAALQGVRRFTADASHQMRTPLSILRTHIALLRTAPSAEEAASSIEDIDHASARLQQLLVQLIALARADHAYSQEPGTGSVDIVAVARAVAADHAPQAVQGGIDLRFAGPAAATAATNEPLAAELIANLVDNAVRYNRPGGTVRVSVDDLGATVVVAIEDDGPGIAPVDRERAFDRFVRLDGDAARTGSGLGLAIARTLAEAIGAKLGLVDAPTLGGLRAEIAFCADADRLVKASRP